MIKKPETSIWKNTPEGKKHIKTKIGLPSPIPKQGESVYDSDFGNTICTGLEYSGSENNIREVILTIQ